MLKKQFIISLTAVIICILSTFIIISNPVEASISKNVVDNISSQPVNMYTNPDTGTAYTATEGILAKQGYYNGGTSMATESPIQITFNNVTAPNLDTTPWFSINYLDTNSSTATSASNLPGFVNFPNQAAANNFYYGNDTSNFNQYGVLSKETQNTNGTYTLRSGTSYKGGYLQASGNVPIHATFAAKYANLVDDTMAGNWGIMIKVSLPVNVDVKSMANAIAWDKAYFYLTMVPVNFNNGSVYVNFPLQFDHHVYLDPEDSQSFFLKVKGVPFIINHSDALFNYAEMSLLNPTSNSIDYGNNVNVNTSNGKSSLTYLDTLNHKVSGLFPSTNAWDPYPFDTTPPVMSLGPVGKACALENLLYQNSRRATSWNIITNGIYRAVSNWLTNNGLNGNAHVNFNFDISKYNGNLQKQYQPLTKGNLFPSPYADGNFNTSTRNAVGITMYATNQLTDPFSVGNQNMLNAGGYTKVAGISPMDYAVVQQDQLNKGTNFPVTTNFTSWNAFAVPFDWQTNRRTIAPNESEPTPSGTDTDSKIAASIQNRTAYPDLVLDGVLVNDGLPFTPTKNFSDTGLTPDIAHNVAGAVTPKRYTKVYAYYDFDSSQPDSPGAFDPHELTDDSKLSVNVTPGNASSSGGAINPVMTNGIWTIGGTYNSIPILSTPLKVNEQVAPQLNLNTPDLIVLSRTALLNNQTYDFTNGTFSDQFPSPDVLSVQKDGTTALGSNNTLTKNGSIALHFKQAASANGTVTADTSGSNINVNIGVPTTDQLDTYTFTLNRPKGINVANKWQVSDTASNTATKTIQVWVVDDVSTDLSMTKQFVLPDASTARQNFVGKTGDSVSVNSTAKNNSNVPMSEIDVLVPNVAGASISGMLASIQENSDNTVSVSTGFSPIAGMALYRFMPNTPLPVGQTLSYTYQYNVSNITSVPSLSNLTDYGVSSSDYGQIIGSSNSIQLLKTTDPQLLSVPDLDFSTQVKPTAGQGTKAYVAKNSSAKFTIYDPSTSNWILSGRLSPFAGKTGLLAKDQSGVSINLGVPNNDNEADLLGNQTADPLSANDETAMLYAMDRDAENNYNPETQLEYMTANNKITLSVPDNLNIANGKYSATMNYILTNGPQ